MSNERKQALQQMTPPSNMTQLRSFLGTANYFRDYIPDFAHLTRNSDSQEEQTSLEEEATEDSVMRNADTQPRRRSRRKPLSADEWVWVEVDQAVALEEAFRT